MVVSISSPGLKSMPMSRISSDSDALRVIAISSRSQPNISARPVRIVSRLRLEYLPHRVSGGVFLLPDVTNERFGDDARARRNAAVIEIHDAARDGERVLNSRPVVFIIATSSGVRCATLFVAASMFFSNDATVAEESAARPRLLPEMEMKSRRVCLRMTEFGARHEMGSIKKGMKRIG